VSSSGEEEDCLGTTCSEVVGLEAPVMTLAAAFFFGIPAAGLGPAVDLGSGFLGLAVFLVAATFGCLDASVTDWEKGFGIGCGMVVVAFTTRPPDNVILPLSQFHPLSEGPGALSFRGGRVVCGGALSSMLGCWFCKSRPHFFSLDSAPIVRSVVSPAATALGLFSRDRETTGEVGAATSDAPGHVSSILLRVSKALAALALQ
jgi:hypothetical protein